MLLTYFRLTSDEITLHYVKGKIKSKSVSLLACTCLHGLLQSIQLLFFMMLLQILFHGNLDLRFNVQQGTS